MEFGRFESQIRNVQKMTDFEDSFFLVVLVVFWASWKVGGTPLDPPGVGDQAARPLGAQEYPPGF